MPMTVTGVPIHYKFHLQGELCLITTIFLYQCHLHKGWASRHDEKLNPANVIDWEDLTLKLSFINYPGFLFRKLKYGRFHYITALHAASVLFMVLTLLHTRSLNACNA